MVPAVRPLWRTTHRRTCYRCVDPMGTASTLLGCRLCGQSDPQALCGREASFCSRLYTPQAARMASGRASRSSTQRPALAHHVLAPHLVLLLCSTDLSCHQALVVNRASSRSLTYPKCYRTSLLYSDQPVHRLPSRCQRSIFNERDCCR